MVRPRLMAKGQGSRGHCKEVTTNVKARGHSQGTNPGFKAAMTSVLASKPIERISVIRWVLIEPKTFKSVLALEMVSMTKTIKRQLKVRVTLFHEKVGDIFTHSGSR